MNTLMTTWRRELIEALAEHGESFADIVRTTLSETELDKEFDPGYGCTEGVPFTTWTNQRVYFPWTYDGAEGVASVSRDPSDEKTTHVGG